MTSRRGPAGAAGSATMAGGGDAPCTPCGGCRQKLREFGVAGPLVRIVDDGGAELLRMTLAELLPHAFGPENLAARA